MEPTRDESPLPAADANEADARRRLSNRTLRRLRHFWRMLPSAPRCKLCTSPFDPPMGPVLRLMGKGRWPGNPRYCGGCFKSIYRNREGAEIECTLFFADVRGSTQLAETMRAGEFRALLDRFYATAAEVLIDEEAIVDKFVGDEVVGIFVPAMTENHARQAIDAGLALLRATGHETDAPWIPIGIGVNTGTAYVGAVGTAEHVEFTALGDAVNVTARLASAAGHGELLVTQAAATAAQLELEPVERRSLDLRGRTETTDVLVLTVSGAGSSDLPSLEHPEC
jgi:adenylate cyclase